MTTHVLFSNSPLGSRDFTINFFYERSAGVKSAQLACPFFSEVEPLRILRSNGCGRVQLLVRLCAITSPAALRLAHELGDVQIRYFTADTFHAKFYILGKHALIGSANLTGTGLNSNRELSIAVTDSEEWFDEVPALFEELWNRAAVLTDDALNRFGAWHRDNRLPSEVRHIDGIDDVSPETTNVNTKTVSSERTYLETYRREYYETFIPSYREVKVVYESTNQRHPDLGAYPIEYDLACTRFRRHQVWCDNRTGGGSWRGGSLRGSSSLKPCA